jgi:hypothetical protein
MSLIKLKNNALDNLTSFEGSASLGDMVLVSSATASSSASIEFSLGSYKEYKFFFVNMHPATNSVRFQFNFSIDNGSNYNVTKTSTSFRAYHSENDASTELSYESGSDLAQGTGFQVLDLSSVGNGNDEAFSGVMSVFNPSSNTFVKHFIATGEQNAANDFSHNGFIAGYANTTSALTNIKFQMSSGNIDDGKILMFGLN